MHIGFLVLPQFSNSDVPYFLHLFKLYLFLNFIFTSIASVGLKDRVEN